MVGTPCNKTFLLCKLADTCNYESQGEIAEASKAEATAQALKASGKTKNSVSARDMEKGNTDEGAAKREKDKKLHRLTRKKRRRMLAREADERQSKEEAEELKAQGRLFSLAGG